MHPEVIEYVQRYATDDAVTVLDIGGRDLNGSTRSLFPLADYTVLDIREDPEVDIVADAATWTPSREYDLVLCTEVFEHTPDWRDIIVTAHAALKPGGRLVVTCAGPGRAPHSAIAATGLQPGEYYQNVHPDEMRHALEFAGFGGIEVERLRRDVRATAVK